jgi:two-component system chemotaxis response regulator CheB
MVSTLTRKGADVSLLALELGAVDIVAKPSEPGAGGWERAGAELRAKIRAAASARVVPREAARPVPPAPEPSVACHERALVAVGASTGGVEALREVLCRLPAGMPPILVTQHMPAGFTQRFAQRLDESCALHVREAEDGMPLGRGEVAIAPGNRHLAVERRGSGYACALRDGEPVCGHRPSVDVLFRSAAAAAGRHAVGVILTGMGRDGADGLGAMREAGARTIGQDEASCLVYGMPRAAFEAGAVVTQAPLRAVPGRILADLAAEAARAA